jgi:hypothetical protein
VCDVGFVNARYFHVWLLMLATWLAGGAFPLRAQTNAASTNLTATNSAPSPGRPDFNSFKSLAERNIFNGSRSGQRITSTRSSSRQRSVRVESFSLVGTLLSEKGPVAFFDGSSSEFHKVLKPGGKIAGFRVQEILHAGVRLENGTTASELRVGSGMSREDEGLWKVAESASSHRSRPSSGSSDVSARVITNGGEGSGAASNPPPAEVNDVLKRLMEQREKE